VCHTGATGFGCGKGTEAAGAGCDAGAGSGCGLRGESIVSLMNGIRVSAPKCIIRTRRTRIRGAARKAAAADGQISLAFIARQWVEWALLVVAKGPGGLHI